MPANTWTKNHRNRITPFCNPSGLQTEALSITSTDITKKSPDLTCLLLPERVTPHLGSCQPDPLSLLWLCRTCCKLSDLTNTDTFLTALEVRSLVGL